MEELFPVILRWMFMIFVIGILAVGMLYLFLYLLDSLFNFEAIKEWRDRNE